MRTVCMVPNMLHNPELSCPVAVPKSLQNVPIPKSLVMRCLLYQLSVVKSTEEIGYILAVTKILSIEKQKAAICVSRECPSSRCVVCNVKFICRAYKPQKGEIMIGTVYRVLKDGVFMKCGPMKAIYLPSLYMPTYQYVGGEQQDQDTFYLNPDDLSRIQKDVNIRFMVHAFRWQNGEPTKREFQILATIKGESLGPLSSVGSEDAMDF